jgi:diguanylate cyclase (GGDEF)-like protein
LDLRTLFIITILINIIIAVIMSIYWRTQKTYAGFGFWTLANVAMALTFSLFALKGVLSDFFTVILANTTAIAGAICRYAGVRFFWGAKKFDHSRLHQLVVLCCCIILYYFTFIGENIMLRLLIVSIVISGYFLATAQSMLMGIRQGYSYEAKTLMFLNLLYAIFLLGRVVEWHFHPEARYILNSSPMNILYFSAILILEVAAALMFLMLNSQRLARNLIAVQKELEKLAASDVLTGLYNRRKLQELSEAEITNSRRCQCTSSLLLIDLDYLKQMNDTWGHPAGDALITSAVKAIHSHLRPTDILGRLGGDEFVAILQATPVEDAKTIAEQIRQAVQNQPFIWDEQELSMSVSIGVAALCDTDANWNDWIKRADLNLYQAKSFGRNQVV